MTDIPAILYKYRDWDNDFHKKIIYENSIYLPSTNQFNDPFEGSIPFVYDEGEFTDEKIFMKMYSMAKSENPKWNDTQLHEFVFQKQKENWIKDPKHQEYCNDENRKKIENTFGIFCLTSLNNNFLMWSHYSNSHKGICIGFDSKILFQTIGGSLEPVDYTEIIPKFKFFEDIFIFFRKMLSTKGKMWEYENEYRITCSGKARETLLIPSNCIKEIILGCKMSLKDKFEIIEFVKKEHPNWQVFDAKKHSDFFELKIERVF